MIYSILHVIAKIFFGILFRLEAKGTHHIPETGPVVMCSNHISYWDPPVLGTPLKRRVHYMAKAELFEVPLLSWLIRELGAFPVKRGGVSKDSIRTAQRLLQEGKMIGIFPEGTRTRDGSAAAKRGAASLALKTGATVIPVAIIGNYKPFRKVRIHYGPPVDLSEFAGDDSPQAQERATVKIMTAIRGLEAVHEWK